MVFKVGRKFVYFVVGLLLVAICSWVILAGRSVPERVKEAAPVTSSTSTKKPETVGQDRGFFSEYRLERERTRDQQVELLREMLNNANLDPKSREKAAARLVEISMTIDREMKAEALVKARGYEDCVVIVQPSLTTVIVSYKGAAIPLDEENELKEQVASVIQCRPNHVCVITRASVK
ncbi:SpoIIIAH-like family protein [Syntrophothermus lipocalidus]|uniref:SpoIIIAH-like family protein n=1 Tax=Syntrophothermus lipocalidus TaxID=86170 RepID=UPI00031D6FD0|nr:SpoIIIAH-like family protein [Syntrophothermus lipocalidus]